MLEAAVPVNPTELRTAVEVSLTSQKRQAKTDQGPRSHCPFLNLQSVMHKHRSPKYCQRILDRLDAHGKGET